MSTWTRRRLLTSAATALPAAGLAVTAAQPARAAATARPVTSMPVAEHFHPGGPDSRVLWAPGGNHGAGLADLSPADRTWAQDALLRWAGQG
ncbi:hypothetical protein ACWGBH_14155 [Streptomyces massasporeus]